MSDFTFRVSWRVTGSDRIASNTFHVTASTEDDAWKTIISVFPTATLIILEV